MGDRFVKFKAAAVQEMVRQVGPDAERLSDQLRAELRQLLRELLSAIDHDEGKAT